MSDITRENHETGELWVDTTAPMSTYLYDPAWIDSVVSTLKVNKSTTDSAIKFTDKNHNVVGKLFVENGVVKFEGAHDPSVRAFLNNINLGWLEEIQMAKKVATHNALERCLTIIDQWAEDRYALVTELVKQLKQDEYFH